MPHRIIQGPSAIRTELPAQATVSRFAFRLKGRQLGERGVAIAITLALELLLFAALVSLSLTKGDPEAALVPAITTFDARQQAERAEEAAREDAEGITAASPETEPEPVEETDPVTRNDTSVMPIDYKLPPRLSLAPPTAPPPSPTQPANPDAPRAVIREDRNYGPPDVGGRNSDDSAIVGTAPDGQPLYAARWFREPTRQEMAGYLSAVEAPAWALIACKTAPRWEVIDCVPLDQYPARSNIMNAVLASTWQFQVRPPRRGGESLVGSWVRIRISYGT